MSTYSDSIPPASTPVFTVGPDGVAFTPDAEGEITQPSRRPPVRAKTISIKRLSKRELERGRTSFPDVPYDRPATRGDCLQGVNAERPCPFVSCKFHLYLDVNPRTGSIKINYPDKEPWELDESCALDVADNGGATLEDVGETARLTRERIRQLESKGLKKLRALSAIAALQDYWE